MTMWTPDLRQRVGPRYLAIAEALADDAGGGRLRPGTRLPTHRDLADRLGVTVGTITRAYAEATRRGLVTGEVGRGTFVRAAARPVAPAAAPVAEAGLIDLSANLPPAGASQQKRHPPHPGRARRKRSRRLLAYPPEGGAAAPRGGRSGCGRGRHSVDRLLVTSGSQHGTSACAPFSALAT